VAGYLGRSDVEKWLRGVKAFRWGGEGWIASQHFRGSDGVGDWAAGQLPWYCVVGGLLENLPSDGV
jgi:hypothetical protein